MNRFLNTGAWLLCLSLIAGAGVHADSPAESERLHSIARELSSVRSLVHSSAQATAKHAGRLRFNYDYVLDALDYLIDSSKTHTRICCNHASAQWDLNLRARLQTPAAVVVTAPLSNRQSTGGNEQARLSDIARELELVRSVVKRASLDAAQHHSRITFDYEYMLEVLVYLDYAVRAHLSLQNAQPRTQWDRHRQRRLNTDEKVAIQ